MTVGIGTRGASRFDPRHALEVGHLGMRATWDWSFPWVEAPCDVPDRRAQDPDREAQDAGVPHDDDARWRG